MKTAISLPDDLYQRAEVFAQKHNYSRSELYAQALDTFLKTYEQAEIIRQLNEVYETENSELDAALAQAQFAALSKEKW
ncbi:MAG: hypothetical protein K1Y36_05275 [Blastocatellia bacterium]|nr:hypothetical protein [Blastocatellia bacterium]